MSPFDIRTLDEFNTRISAENGMSVNDFQVNLGSLFEQPRSDDDLKDHRLKRRRWKKLADEVMPVSHFLRSHGIESGQIRFPLDNHPPDCWLWDCPLWKDGGDNPVGVEVTIAQARERHHLDKELVETGQGRGFIGVSDDAPQDHFDRAMSGQRKMYSTDHALSAARSGICRCLSQKDDPKFAGFVLLIQAPLVNLPQEHWEAIKIDLCAAAAALPFREVHVIGDKNEGLWASKLSERGRANCAPAHGHACCLRIRYRRRRGAAPAADDNGKNRIAPRFRAADIGCVARGSSSRGAGRKKLVFAGIDAVAVPFPGELIMRPDLRE